MFAPSAGAGIGGAQPGGDAVPDAVREQLRALIIDRFSESQNPTTGILDALSFITLTALQWGLVLYVTVRDRRARARQAAPQ